MSNTFINKIINKRKGGTKKKTGILQRAFIFAMSIVGALAYSLAPVVDVFAASNWDSLINTTSSLLLRDTNGGHTQDVTGSYLSLMSQYCPTQHSELLSAVGEEDGRLSITQVHVSGGTMRTIVINWSTNPASVTQFNDHDDMYGYDYSISVMPEDSVALTVNTSGQIQCHHLGGDEVFLGTPTGYIYVFMSTYPVTYPTGYEGEYMPAPAGSSDFDSDGLDKDEEDTLGTSDFKIDTDMDGLADPIESITHNAFYEEMFCKQTSPFTCADPDPTTKDLYVEIDWMDDGTEEYKPTTTQLGLVEDKFAALDINFHADTGQYGGGNVLQSYQAPLDIFEDFYGFKWGFQTLDPANFDTDRYKIWHYMISGYNFDDGSIGSSRCPVLGGSLCISGGAEPGGDDVFLSYGLLASTRSGSILDNAIAGTIIHELGHNLCLSNDIYTGQDAACLFSGIDNTSASSNYHSAMNYNYQFTNNYSYSDGTNGTGDHDDISAIMVGMDDFLNDDDSSAGGPSV